VEAKLADVAGLDLTHLARHEVVVEEVHGARSLVADTLP
jgi:hypothetical protein